MTTYTPILALPKPEITDRLNLGYDQIADLADAVEAQIAPWRPKLFHKPTNTSRINNNTYAADAYFTAMAVPANTVWDVTARFDWSAVLGADWRWYWGLTGTAFIGLSGGSPPNALGKRWPIMAPASVTDVSDTNVSLATRDYNSACSSGGDTVSGFYSGARDEFLVSGGASGGTFQLVWAPILNTTTVVLNAGSHIVMNRAA